MRFNPSGLFRLIAGAGLMCVLSPSQDAKVLASFKSQTHGYALQYPQSWRPQIASDIFSIYNFPASRAVRAVVLPEGGAGINVVTSSQAVRDPEKLPKSLDDLVALDNAHHRIIGRGTAEIDDGRRKLSVIEVKTICCDDQESVKWYFEIDSHMFVARLFYWKVDPNADKLRETLKQIVLSLKVTSSGN